MSVNYPLIKKALVEVFSSLTDAEFHEITMEPYWTLKETSND